MCFDLTTATLAMAVVMVFVYLYLYLQWFCIHPDSCLYLGHIYVFRFDIGDTGGGGGHVLAPCVIVLSRVLIASHLLLIPKLDFCKFIKLHFLSGGDGDLYHLNQPKGSIRPAMN